MPAAIVNGWPLDRFRGTPTCSTDDHVGAAVRRQEERAQLVPATVGVRG